RGYRRYAGAGADTPRTLQEGIRPGHAARKTVRRGTGALERAASGSAVSAGRGGGVGLGVVPANAGTHNHRTQLLNELGLQPLQNSVLSLWVPGRASLARDDSGGQFTELLTTTSISFVPGRLIADDSTDFNSAGSLTLIASRPRDFAMPVKSTGGSAKS